MICGSGGFMKFCLLLWKNYLLQKRHKVQTLFEIFLPLVYAWLLVWIRTVVEPVPIKEAIYFKEFDPRSPFGTAVLGGKYILYAPDTPGVKKIIEIAEQFQDANENSTLNDIINQLIEGGFSLPANITSILENSTFSLNQTVFGNDQGLSKYEFRGFNNEAALLQDYQENADYNRIHNASNPNVNQNPVLAALIFKTDPEKDTEIKYQLRFPAVQHGHIAGKWWTHVLYIPFPLPGPRDSYGSEVNITPTFNPNEPFEDQLKKHLPLMLYKLSRDSGGVPGYWSQGFLFLQSAVDSAIIYSRAADPKILGDFAATLNRYPYPPYIHDNYITALQMALPIFLVLSFIVAAVNISKSIAHEKERRLKESMKMMGLPNWLHWTAWFTKSFIFLLISEILMILSYKYQTHNENLSVITHGDASVIFVFLLAYIFSVISFSFLVASFFSTANSASTACGVVFFLTYFPYMFTSNRYSELSTGVKLVMCLFSNTAMGFGCHLISVAEGTTAGVTWDTITMGATPDDSLTILYIILMMLADGVVYLLLAIYIEGVFPGDFGVPLPWYFPFTTWFWTGKVRGGDAIKVHPETSSLNSNEFFEKEPEEHAGIQIIGLGKTFGKKVAVHDLSLNFYENQVTALLGHNGAGKTTTMSMITGLFGPTSGTAIVNGFDIRTDVESVRGSLGLCPQHDVLFDEMTVEEHLKFFCLLKGADKNFVKFEIDRMLFAIKLEDKRNAQAHTLSGGMKRKLSVGIALIGGSKVVLLDEPTSGMDPGARRATWDLISSERKGRTIVLSTHYMDEADLLGDRIAIMAHGKAICCGSSLFLKKKYGGGYHLIIVKEPSCKVELITQLLQKRMPEVDVEHDVGSELSYSLPDAKASVFPEVFEELEKRKAELGITSYGCSITQMEEVFIRAGEQAENEKNGIPPENKPAQYKPSNKEAINLIKDDMPEIPRSNPSLKSNPSNHQDQQPSAQAIDMTASDVPAVPSSTSTFKPAPLDRSNSEPRNVGTALISQQLRAMLVKKYLHALRNKILLISQTLVPVTFLVIALILLRILTKHRTVPVEMPLNLYKYSLLGSPVTTMECPAELSNACDTYEGVARFQSNVVNTGDTIIENYLIDQSIKNLARVNFQHLVGVKVSNFTKANGNATTKFKGFFNNQPFHTPPVALNFIYNTILHHATGDNTLRLSLSNWPLPFTRQDKVQTLEDLSKSEGFQVGFNISFGMSFLAASFCVFIIKERETKSKHLQYVSGVKFPIFWLAHWLFDFVNYLIPCFALLIVLIAFQSEDFDGPKMKSMFLLVLLMYGWSVIPMMYLFSFLFTVPSTGYVRMTFFNILSGSATILTIMVLSVPEVDAMETGELLEWYFMLFPNFDMGHGIGLLAMNKMLHELCPTVPKSLCGGIEIIHNPCCTKYPVGFLAWKSPGIGRNLFFLFFIGCLCHLCLFLIESKIIEKIRYINESRRYAGGLVEKDPTTVLEDSDVTAEKERVRNADEEMFKTDNMILRDMTKYYNKFLAVDRICLGVKQGECFGLLGINGAGKTTTFKMLTGDISISYGDAFVTGISVKSHIKDVQKVIGYCPQFDALIPELTGRETIQLFARLRGIKESEIDDLVERLAADLIFSEHVDKPCGTYSGGNKRKLSTAIALIGNPPVVFLDEPTSGMDPVARRHLCNAIIKVRDSGTSVILTSHVYSYNMEECEALCTRLAIMVNGKFRCLGSSQHLKNKFGDGFTIIAQMQAMSTENEERKRTRTSVELGRRRVSIDSKAEKWEQDLQPLRDFIEGNFTGCELKDVHPAYVNYHIPQDSEVTWAEMFKKMEQAKTLFGLEAYSVGQTSLEQVFLGFAKAQCNDDG